MKYKTDVELLEEYITRAKKEEATDEDWDRFYLIRRIIVRRWLTEAVERRETEELISAFVHFILGSSEDADRVHEGLDQPTTGS